VDERASEHVDELDVRDEAGPWPAYTMPRLTRLGAIARVTEDDPDDGSGIPR
jgi:hypothetical protein